ncbi:acyl-CoA dehydrogenase domain protein [Kribbella flavida DSM 17836]|uniref:Acyl-CoA dehydrogenase domain protein n=1 Tax=Kribbella flavida (strain DSM 17836 / JCM 10339 / NBRC 14399) TaxID=479435 RepID=D2PSN2_KRIFD|nr:acyl-CoA dehydrogenase family protein [Kribbella flavida]ADB33170.1 acyl-CoA dehydrogenase domain protein [Kribbella flavida DSM 17836]
MNLPSDPLIDQLGRSVRETIRSTGPDPVRDEPSDLREVRSQLEAHATTVLKAVLATELELPAEVGGLDLGLEAGTVVAQELGRAGLPDCYNGPGLLADLLAVRRGPGELPGELMNQGTPVEVCGLTGPAAATAVPAGWRLDGRVCATSSTASAICTAVASGNEVLLVLLDQRTVAQLTSRTAGGVRTIELASVEVDDRHVVGSLGTGWPLSDPDGLLARLRVRHAAWLVGIGYGAHARAATYAQQRRQFDRPLLANQGVSFPLARAWVALRAAELAVRRIARLVDDGGLPDPLAAGQALGLALEAATASTRTALQTHGARGLTACADLGRYYLAIRDSAALAGPPATLWSELGQRERDDAAARRHHPADDHLVASAIS